MIEPLNVTLSGPWVVFLLLLLGLPLAVVVVLLERLVRMPPPRWFTSAFLKSVQALALAFITGTVAFFALWLGRVNSAATQVNVRASSAGAAAAPTLPATTFDDLLNMFLLVGIALFLVLYAIDRRSEPFGVESHWGGLGDGLSGRRVSASIVHLTVAFVLLGILVTRTPAGRSLLELMRAHQAQTSSSSSEQNTTTEKPAADAQGAKPAESAGAPVPPPAK